MSEPEKKKRGRKKKINVENIQIFIEKKDTNLKNEVVVKKRGRKPKGGKIIQNELPNKNEIKIEPNVILHLKCSINDIDINYDNNNNSTGMKYNPIIEQVESFNFENIEKNAFLLDEDFSSKNNIEKSIKEIDSNCV